MQDTKYFKGYEFQCPCCGVENMSDRFIEKLTIARHNAGIPFVISSGYRCQKHNREVGGVEDSAHTNGFAADIHVHNSRERFLMLKSLFAVGFSRIGIGKDFIHVDDDYSKPRKVVWGYYGSDDDK